MAGTTWYHGTIDKRAGGTVVWGFGNNSRFVGWFASGGYLWDRYASDAGMGGYLAFGAYYVKDAASYLYLWVTT